MKASERKAIYELRMAVRSRLSKESTASAITLLFQILAPFKDRDIPLAEIQEMTHKVESGAKWSEIIGR